MILPELISPFQDEAVPAVIDMAKSQQKRRSLDRPPVQRMAWPPGNMTRLRANLAALLGARLLPGFDMARLPDRQELGRTGNSRHLDGLEDSGFVTTSEIAHENLMLSLGKRRYGYLEELADVGGAAEPGYRSPSLLVTDEHCLILRPPLS